MPTRTPAVRARFLHRRRARACATHHAGEDRSHGAELVQHLLEEQLVDLVRRDEEHLLVRLIARLARLGHLRREQLNGGGGAGSRGGVSGGPPRRRELGAVWGCERARAPRAGAARAPCQAAGTSHSTAAPPGAWRTRRPTCGRVGAVRGVCEVTPGAATYSRKAREGDGWRRRRRTHLSGEGGGGDDDACPSARCGRSGVGGGGSISGRPLQRLGPPTDGG